MRASMAAGFKTRSGCRHGDSNAGNVWGDPHGLIGTAALVAMAIKNGGQNQAAIAALDVKPGESVIEIGCGPGMGLRRALKAVGRDGFVAGVDQSGCAAHMAAHAVHHSILRGNAAVICSPAADLPFRDMMFDKAFAVNSFQFWPDPARALYEIARVLGPRGRLVITQRAASLENPSDFAGAAGGMERIGRATQLLKTLGWDIIDERVVEDGPRLLAASVIASRPD